MRAEARARRREGVGVRFGRRTISRCRDDLSTLDASRLERRPAAALSVSIGTAVAGGTTSGKQEAALGLRYGSPRFAGCKRTLTEQRRVGSGA